MSTAAATAAASAAAIAAQQAREAARRAECQGVFANFEPHGATLEGMRGYATCVRDVHGLAEPLSAADLVALKVIVLVALICIAAGVFWGWSEDGPVGAMLGAMLALLMAAFIVGCAAGVLFVVGAI